MKGLKFYLVDVFAEEKLAGNQLAVVRNAKGLSSSDMQRITKEMNFSETSFILTDETRNGGYDVRIFTPKEEVPFAGHPTLGTAYVIKQEIINKRVDSIVLNLEVGQIHVTFDGDVLWMKQMQPQFGEVIEFDQMAEVLGLKVEEIDIRFKVQEVSTGLPFIIVPLKTLESVKRAKIQSEKLQELTKELEAKDILVFCPETYQSNNDLNVRVFVDYHGIPEDPATGSANGCLGGYLVKNRYFGKDEVDVRIEQGYEIGRKSLLLVKAKKIEEGYEILVGGNVVSVGAGEFM